MNISSRHSNSNFAHHFVIYWLLQTGANKNQNQDKYQRETMYNELYFMQNWWGKKVKRGELNTYIYVNGLSYVLRDFLCIFPGD